MPVHPTDFEIAVAAVVTVVGGAVGFAFAAYCFWRAWLEVLRARRIRALRRRLEADGLLPTTPAAGAGRAARPRVSALRDVSAGDARLDRRRAAFLADLEREGRYVDELLIERR